VLRAQRSGERPGRRRAQARRPLRPARIRQGLPRPADRQGRPERRAALHRQRRSHAGGEVVPVRHGDRERSQRWGDDRIVRGRERRGGLVSEYQLGAHEARRPVQVRGDEQGGAGDARGAVGRARRALCAPDGGSEGRVGKKPGFFLKPDQLFFWGFFVFFLFFLYICPEERVFRVFLVSRILLGASRRVKL